MPLLGALLGSLFSGLASVLVELFGKKLAVGIAAVAAFGALTVGLMAAISATLSTLIQAFPVPAWSTFVWVLFPPEVSTAISVCLSTDALVALYRWNADNVELMARS